MSLDVPSDASDRLVETTEQFAYLKERGCDLGQGYLFSRPVPIAELIAWVESITSEAALLSLSNRSVYKYHATSTYPEEGH